MIKKLGIVLMSWNLVASQTPSDWEDRYKKEMVPSLDALYDMDVPEDTPQECDLPSFTQGDEE